MPKKLHRNLSQSAKKAGLKPGTERYKAYVHGTMDKIEKAKGRKKK